MSFQGTAAENFLRSRIRQLFSENVNLFVKKSFIDRFGEDVFTESHLAIKTDFTCQISTTRDRFFRLSLTKLPGPIVRFVYFHPR